MKVLAGLDFFNLRVAFRHAYQVAIKPTIAPAINSVWQCHSGSSHGSSTENLGAKNHY
jgi:hypothetical protein